MPSVRECAGCEYFAFDERGVRCEFEGLCAYKRDGKPFGYRTPEDMMQIPERRGDGRRHA